MYVERHGAGSSIYFGLHGWGGDRRTFAPLAAHVPAHATFYSADLPGCGHSPAPHEWSVAAIVEEIIAAVANTGATQATLVGNCGGGVFALFAAQRAPELIARVVMIDPFAYLPRYFKLFVSDGFGRRAYDATFANAFGRWLTNQALRGRRTDETDLTASFDATDHAVARRYLKLFAEMGEVAQFSDVRAPVVLVYGEQTFGAVKRSVALLQGVLPHACVAALAGAGHVPLAEATEPLCRIIFAPADDAVLAQTTVQATAQAEERLHRKESEAEV